MNLSEFDKIVQQVKEEFEIQLGRTEMIYETKMMVDQLTLELLETAQNFIKKNSLTNESQYLGVMVAHRSFFYLATTVTPNWCLDLTAREFVKKNLEALQLPNDFTNNYEIKMDVQ